MRGRIATARKYGPAARDYALFRTLYHAGLHADEASGSMLDRPDLHFGRGPFGKAFTVHSVSLLKDRIVAIISGLLDDLADRLEFDLVEDFALRLSAAVIAEVLQVPESDASNWHRRFWDLARFRGVTRYFPLDTSSDPGALDAATRASSQAASYTSQLIDEHRSMHDGGIVSGLFAAREQDDRPREEILYTLILILGAGLYTTSGQLSNAFRAVLSRPEVADLR